MPVGTPPLETLLERIQCLMWDGLHQRWDARARGASEFGHGDTPLDAVRRALGMVVPVVADEELNADLF